MKNFCVIVLKTSFFADNATEWVSIWYDKAYCSKVLCCTIPNPRSSQGQGHIAPEDFRMIHIGPNFCAVQSPPLGHLKVKEIFAQKICHVKVIDLEFSCLSFMSKQGYRLRHAKVKTQLLSRARIDYAKILIFNLGQYIMQ